MSAIGTLILILSCLMMLGGWTVGIVIVINRQQRRMKEWEGRQERARDQHRVTLERDIVREVAGAVGEAVKDAVVSGAVEGVEGLMKAGMWGPQQKVEAGEDQPREQGEEGEQSFVPWWDWTGEDEDGRWSTDPTDGAYPDDLHAGTASIPHGMTPLDLLGQMEEANDGSMPGGVPTYSTAGEDIQIDKGEG